jgi:ADP-ribose pyrophosphatase YjhB (NUDIX family)
VAAKLTDATPRVPRANAVPGYHERVSAEGTSDQDRADCFRHEALGVVFQVRAGRLNVLLWRRERAPFEGAWALPGGPLGHGERLGTSASRQLAAKVDIPEIAHLEQLETRSDPARDPRRRVLATAYLALVPPEARPRLPADTAWHRVDELPATAFDHGSIVESARERLRGKLSYTNIGFALAPETFTISQLRDVYAAALGYQVSATNLQRILTRRGVIEPTPGIARPAASGGRPASLYRFAVRELVVTNAFAAFRPRADGTVG